MKELTKNDMLKCLKALNDRMAKDNIHGEMIVFGGSALALAYGVRNATMDIDALYRPREDMNGAIFAVTKAKRLDSNWLNDDIREFIGKGDAVFDYFPSSEYLNMSNLKVSVVDAEPLLAMKLVSARIDYADMQDSVELMRHLNIESIDQVNDILNKYKGIYGDLADSNYARNIIRGFVERTYAAYSDKYLHMEDQHDLNNRATSSDGLRMADWNALIKSEKGQVEPKDNAHRERHGARGDIPNRE